jgi:hypothetical protein
LTERGKYEELEKVLQNKDESETKNVLLQPIYRELKSLIRLMTYSEEAKMYLDYVALRDKIKEYYVCSLFIEEYRIMLNLKSIKKS